MRFIGAFLAVTAISTLQMYAAAPLGLAWDLDRFSILVACFLGGMVGVVVLVFVGPGAFEAVKRGGRRILGRPEPEEKDDEEPEEPPGRFEKLVDRFGAPFLGIAGPLTVGGFAAAIIGVARGYPRWKMIIWLAIGQAVVLTAYVNTLAAVTS